MLELADYQKQAIEFMKPLAGMLLADEAGLGKTAMAIKSLQDFPVLVVSPNSGKWFWRDEITKWTNGAAPKVAIYEPWHREDSEFWTGDGVFIIHWEALRYNAEALARLPWGTVIADEAHKAKNRKSQQSKLLRQLSKTAKHRYALTGSPFINRPDELWAILNFLYPRRYSSYWRWFNEFVLAEPRPFGGYDILGVKDRDRFAAELRPFTLRRYKKDVLKELPDKIYVTLPIELAPAQRKAYEELRKTMITELPNNEVLMTPTVLAMLTRLRQISCGLHLVGGPEISTKLDAAVEFIEDNDEPIVVFSQFRGMVGSLAQRLTASKIPFFLMHGDVQPEERSKYIEQFQAGQRRVFIATTQTGGVQITLTRAHTVLFLDSLWSPEMQHQAEDRLHRKGQLDPVRVVTLEAMDTVEQYVARVLATKGALFNLVFNKGDLGL